MAIVKLCLSLVKSPNIMPVLISLISVPQGTLRIISSPEAPDLLLGPPLPEGPPAGTNFSLLNETIPFPPFPALRIY